MSSARTTAKSSASVIRIGGVKEPASAIREKLAAP
jgi:hypothetical protein